MHTHFLPCLSFVVFPALENNKFNEDQYSFGLVASQFYNMERRKEKKKEEELHFANGNNFQGQ